MRVLTMLLLAGALLPVLPLLANDDDTVLPGQEGKTTSDGVAVKTAGGEGPDYVTPDYLKIPFVSLYYVEPTRTTAESVKIDYYVSDWDCKDIHRGDRSERFDVTIRYSSDLKVWKTLEKKGAEPGNGTFELGKLPTGEYTLGVSCRDQRGVLSRVVWHEFRVVEPEALVIKPTETRKPTAADLAAYGIVAEPAGLYAIAQVPVAGMPRNRNELHVYTKSKKPEAKEAYEKLKASVAAKLDAYAASDAGKKLLAAAKDGYVVFVPSERGGPVYKSRLYQKTVFGPGFSKEAFAKRAVANTDGFNRYFAELAKAGVRKVVLPKGVYRLAQGDGVAVPSGLTVDLNGATLKLDFSDRQHGWAIHMTNAVDAHLVNGVFEGNYYEYGFDTCGTGNPEHVGFFEFGAASRYCTVEDMWVRYTVGSGTNFGANSKAGHLENGAYSKPTKYGAWTAGSLDEKGALDPKLAARWTSPFVPMEKLASNKYVVVSRYLGYQGIDTESCYVRIAFYDAAKKPLSCETAMQYGRVLVPAGAAFYRISAEILTEKEASATKLRVYCLRLPRDCAFRRISYDTCRTHGMGVNDGFNLLFEDIDIARSGDESCRCASDAEDGWDGMQNYLFRRVKCHDNPHGDLTVCCGHDFVYEDCDARISADRRVGGACYRNSRLRGSFGCRYRSRLLASRFENCTFVGDVKIGSDRKDDKKVDRANWEIVCDGCTFEGPSPDRPIEVKVAQTGRIRNAKIRNAVLSGDPKRFESCVCRPSDDSELTIRGFDHCTAQKPQQLLGKDKTVFVCSIRDGRFHFRFDVKDEAVCVAETVKHPLDLANGDRVEVYFVPDAEMKKGYRCAEIDASGRVLSYSVDEKKHFDWHWKFATLESESGKTSDGYFVRGSVAVSELESFGVNPKAFHLGVFRADMSAPGKNLHWCSAAPLRLPAHFHQPAMLFPYPAR